MTHLVIFQKLKMMYIVIANIFNITRDTIIAAEKVDKVFVVDMDCKAHRMIPHSLR